MAAQPPKTDRYPKGIRIPQTHRQLCSTQTQPQKSFGKPFFVVDKRIPNIHPTATESPTRTLFRARIKNLFSFFRIPTTTMVPRPDENKANNNHKQHDSNSVDFVDEQTLWAGELLSRRASRSFLFEGEVMSHLCIDRWIDELDPSFVLCLVSPNLPILLSYLSSSPPSIT